MTFGEVSVRCLKQIVAQFADIIDDTRCPGIAKAVGMMIAPGDGHAADGRRLRHFHVERRIANHDRIL
jgi:hypothetical protein